MPSLKPRGDLFWVKIAWSQHGCWEWQASRHRNGYGQFHLPGGAPITAHRAAWVLMHGPVPDGMVVMHICDNRACVRPDHLRLGTWSENSRDMHAKGRARGNYTRRKVCVRRHAPNWYVNPNTGNQACRTCQAEWQRAFREKRRAAAA